MAKKNIYINDETLKHYNEAKALLLIRNPTTKNLTDDKAILYLSKFYTEAIKCKKN